MNANRRIITLGVIALFLAAGLFLSLRRPAVHFVRSPTQVEAAFNPFPVYVPLETVRPVEFPMGTPKLTVSSTKEGKEFQFSWPEENPVPEREISSPNPRTAPLDGEFLELVAFATWYPRENAAVNFLYRHPETLAPLPEGEIDSLGLKTWEYKPPTHETFYPRLRTVFRTNQRHLRLRYWLEDSRTSSFSGQDYNAPDANSALVYRETALQLWHDTPLTLHAEFKTGALQWAELPRRLGAETVIGDRLRVQWLAESEGRFTPAGGSLPSYGKFLIYDSRRPERPAESQTLLRISDQTLSDQFGAVSADGSIVWGGMRAIPLRELIAGVETIPKGDAPLKLVLIPDRAELKFTIAGLPDLPNPRSTRNLFEVNIPYLKLEENLTSGVTNEGSFFNAIISATKTYIRRDNPRDPFERGMSYTFRNVTPNELLTWYMRNYPRSTIQYLPKETTVVISDKPASWVDRLKSWWERNP